MIGYEQSDIVLVDFKYFDKDGSKKRPALILSSQLYHASRQDVIIAAITTNVERVLFGDTIITEWKNAGLLYPSLVKAVVITIERSLIIKKLGTIEDKDFENIQTNLKKCFLQSN